jgi:hypothetical protein
MGDAVALRSELQTLDGGLRKFGRVLFELLHSRRHVGKIAAPVETFAIDAVAFRQIARREARVAVFDPRSAGHALEQERIAPIVMKQRLCETAKRVVYVVRGHRRCDAINICCLQWGILRLGSQRRRGNEQLSRDREHRPSVIIAATLDQLGVTTFPMLARTLRYVDQFD